MPKEPRQSKQNIISAKQGQKQEVNAKGLRPIELYGFFSAGNLGSQAFAKSGTGSPLDTSQTCLSGVLSGPTPWLPIQRGTNKANKFADPRAGAGQNAQVMSVRDRW